MTVAVTGATGHVGANLVRALLEQGRQVRAIVHDDTQGVDGLPVERVRADVRDVDSLRRAFEGADVVYHLAARISLVKRDRALVFATNVDGPRNVCEAALATGVRRLVHFSSIHAFDDRPKDVTVDEGNPAATGDEFPIYDQSKALGEQQVRAAIARGLDAVIVNPTAVIGPHDFRISAMGEVFLDLYHGRLPGLVQGGFDWVDVRDVVKSAMAAEVHGRTGEKYLLSGQWRSVRELADLVESVTGRRTPRFVSPMWLAKIGVPFAVAYAMLARKKPLFTFDSLRALGVNRSISHDKAARELGHSPRPLRETVEALFAWFEQAGYLASRRALPAPTAPRDAR